MQIHTAIRELRASLGLTQRQFATACGRGHGTVTHLESGSKHPNSRSLLALARVAFESGRHALAEIFLTALPGVAEGLLVPAWRAAAAPDADYPRMLFHWTKDPIIVHSRVEERLRGAEWSRTAWPKPEAALSRG